MAATEYTETFAKFILSAKQEYDVLAERIRDGDIPAGHGVSIHIVIPPNDIDRIRFDVIAAMNGDLHGGV